MRAILLGGLFALSVASAAAAAADIDAAPPADARLPERVQLTALDGRAVDLGTALDHPAVLVFADYTCKTLCGPILSFVAHALDESKLTPGQDFKLIVVGLDPKDDAASALSMRHAALGDETALAAASAFLRGTAEQLETLTGALGYHYAYDTTTDQFIHPASAYILEAGGKVSRVLSGIALDGDTMRLGLVEAGQGKVGTFSDQIHLICSSFDPARGTYNLAISRVLTTASLATVLSLGGLIGYMAMARPRRRG